MFDKLIARFTEKKSDHPMGSDEGLDALLADIHQSDPGRQLFDVDEWLAGLVHCTPEIGAQAAMHALLRLDQFSRAGADQLLARYLSAGTREYLTDSVWAALETHAGHLFECYKSALSTAAAAKSDKDQARLARSAARALRAWALRKKLQRFRYRTPDAGLWREAHELLQRVGQLGALQAPTVAYRDEAQTTPLREYLIGLYLEFVPLGNMVPQQVELAEGFLRSCDGLDLSPQTSQLSTGRIDLAAAAGPQRLQQNDPGGGSVRYCSVLKLRGALMKLAAQVRKPEQAPAWLASLPASREQIESGILTLMTHWAQTPPKRGKDRVAQKIELRVVLGFALARRMIAASHFARMGRSLKYQGEDLARLYDESRFGSVAATPVAGHQAAAADQPEVLNPLDILHQLESGGTLAQMEHWVQVDGSATGIGVVVPTILPRHRIGLLICLRYLDGLEWRMGLIRRIGRDAGNRPGIGIETLAWPSICAMAKPVGADCIWTKVADGGHGWSDAIIVRHDARELILPAGAFVAGMELDVRSEEGLWRVRLESLLDSGPDFERIEFTRLS